MATGPFSTAVARYYDGLTRYTAFAARIGLGSAEMLTMHRRLYDAAGRASGERLHELLFAELGNPQGRSLLDAGCGVGGTLFAWIERGGSGAGLTLSPEQCRRASAEAGRRVLGPRCRFICASYDSELDAVLGGERFDAVTAIESLIHAPDPARTVANLAALLKPGGRLAVVDDMPSDGVSMDDPDLREFKRYWLGPGAAPASALRAAFEAARLTIVGDRDLSADVERRPAARTVTLARANRAVRWLLPYEPARRVLDAHYGGLVLERLYERRVMQYRLIVGAASG